MGSISKLFNPFMILIEMRFCLMLVSNTITGILPLILLCLLNYLVVKRLMVRRRLLTRQLTGEFIRQAPHKMQWYTTQLLSDSFNIRWEWNPGSALADEGRTSTDIHALWHCRHFHHWTLSQDCAKCSRALLACHGSWWSPGCHRSL